MENLYNRDMTAPQEQMNLDLAAIRIGQRFDIFFGGMQGPQKFPNPPLLEVLWRAFLRTGTPQFSQLIFTSLDSILFGGVYDHVGGGFFRHSHGRALAGAAFREDALRQGADDRLLHRASGSSTATNCAASASPRPSTSCCAT